MSDTRIEDKPREESASPFEGEDLKAWLSFSFEIREHKALKGYSEEALKERGYQVGNSATQPSLGELRSGATRPRIWPTGTGTQPSLTVASEDAARGHERKIDRSERQYNGFLLTD